MDEVKYCKHARGNKERQHNLEPFVNTFGREAEDLNGSSTPRPAISGFPSNGDPMPLQDPFIFSNSTATLGAVGLFLRHGHSVVAFRQFPGNIGKDVSSCKMLKINPTSDVEQDGAPRLLCFGN